MPADSRIAIVGMAGRFPGARSVEELWRNLLEGRDSIASFTDDELAGSGISGERLADPNYVRARGVLEDAEMFDAAFFGLTPRDAEITDPQHRLFLETCWEALEDAGYAGDARGRTVGVYGGASLNTYLLWRLCRERGFAKELAESYQTGAFPAVLGNDSGFLTTRVSYKLDLTGPSLDLQTACSTSLVAVCVAAGALLSGECDLALAGGVSVSYPQKRGYLYQEGGMGSRDGRCRPFDAAAAGTVFGSGVGVVALKRLEDAIADGDTVHAVLLGWALNNDGSGKVGYTAPSADGQAEVIVRAHAMADVDARSIGFVEGHGTGTPLGDPIEVAGLTRAFRLSTDDRQFCVLGSLKGNVGHLDAAAGVTGLIKAALAVREGRIPPTLHFERPNPAAELESSPFTVSSSPLEWVTGSPRRAGVSAFGVGGTNAHVVLEEPPAAQEPAARRSHQVVTLSARTPAALEAATSRLADHLASHPSADIADVAFTLQAGRRAFDHRRVFVCEDAAEALGKLRNPGGGSVWTNEAKRSDAPVAFLFPGQGSQHVRMGSELYGSERVFRDAIDACAEILLPALGLDLRETMLASASDPASSTIDRTEISQPAIFAMDYALAMLWESWGVRPSALLGHSVGEYVAACVSGVFSLEDALSVVAERARLVAALPAGAMLAVRREKDKAAALLRPGVSIAAVNSPTVSVLSGEPGAVAAIEKELEARGEACFRLTSRHAFHSEMVEPAVAPLAEAVGRVRRNSPRIPWLSSATGEWITEKEAADPAYWAMQLRRPVLFDAALEKLAKDPDRVILEVGPGRMLTSLARHRVAKDSRGRCLASLPAPDERRSEVAAICGSLGRVWLAGGAVDWKAFHADESRRRVPLPLYPFERRRFWREETDVLGEVEAEAAAPVSAAVRDARPPVSAPAPALPPAAAAVPALPRRERLLARVCEILAELSGLGLDDLPGETGFLELGFDSLFLTQVSQKLEHEFGVKIAFRQLLEETATPASVAAVLDERLPASAFAPPAAAEPPSSAPTAADAGSAARPELDRIAEQILALSRQVEALRSGVPAASAGPAMPPPEAAAPSPAAAAAPAASEGKSFPAFGPYKPIDKSASGLTEKQRAALADLTARYTKRTAESKRRTQEHRARFADPRVAAGFRREWKEIVYPIVATRSKGSRLWDVDGNEYVDMLMGFGLNLFGHSPDFVTQAVAKQLEAGVEIGPQSPLAGPVAEKIAALTGVDRVTFCNTGSEAVMAAMRLARTVTGRKKIALFAGSYHGTFDEVLVRSMRPDGRTKPTPIAPGIPQEKAENVVILEYGTQASLETLEKMMPELAAVLVEPVQSRHPDLQPREFLQALRRSTEKAGTALIFDEVITGFRIHPGGAQAHFGVRADLVTYGKVVGGGIPIGVVGGTSQFMDALDGGMWAFGDDSVPEVGVTFFAGTFVRHPLAMAAADAVLDHLVSSGPALQEDLNRKADRFVAALNGVFERRRFSSRVQHCGSILYFPLPADQRMATLLYQLMRERGVHILEGFPCFLTTAHSEEDLAFVLRAFDESLGEMWEGGLLVETSASLAAAASAAPAAADAPAEFPPTEPQKEIWLASQLGADASCAFNESLSLSLEGPLDERALVTSVHELVARHDSLRTTFSSDGEVARVAPTLSIEIPVENLSDASDQDARSARLEAIVAEEAALPFDLQAGPLFRARLVRLSETSHRLFLTAHHLVCDGWSTNVLLDELAALYSSAAAGRAASLPAPESFADYARGLAAASSDSAGAAKAEETAAYWTDVCNAPLPVLDLPLDRPRPPVKSYAGATERRAIAGELARAVRKTGARHGATLFATLLAAFEVLLHRLTGQDDVIVGIPAAGQAVSGRDRLVGHDVHFLPLRSRLDAANGDPGFVAHLKATRRRLLDAYDHQDTTLGALLPRLALPRDPARLPLIEIQFNVERVGAGLSFEGLSAEADPGPKRFVGTDVFFNVMETPDGLTIDCDFNTDLFDRETVRAWLGHYETLLSGIAADPDRTIGALPLLSEAETRDQLARWTRSEPVRGTCVHALFESQAAHAPDAPALDFGGETLAYRELNARANRLAHHLIGLGVKPGALAAISLERSPDMVVALLAVLKAGGAYVPLDPAYPAERTALVLEGCGASVLVTRGGAEPPRVPPSMAVVRLDAEADRERIERESPLNPPHRARPDDLAYVIYTSGSTGTPKGVEIPHRAVSNVLASMAKEPGATARDVLLAVTSIAFDISALELFLPLSVGGRIALASRDEASDGNLLLRRLESSGATILQATPASWRMLIEAGWRGGRPLEVLCGGEALPRDLADELLARSSEVWNLYGPTETTIWSAAGRVVPGAGPVPLGRPIANTRLLVVDRRGGLVPLGVPGELAIGGAGLARGYRSDPERTAEKFVPDPFSAEPGARLYRTGDLVRARRDGSIEFLGRLDHQVKIRGFRVELGEIETALAAHPAVRQCVAAVRQEEPGRSRLIAWVVPNPEAASASASAAPAAATEAAATWEAQWQMLYSKAISEAEGEGSEETDPELRIIRWTGSVASPEEEMAEWVRHASGQIRALAPRRVLEIGVGTGLLLRELASGCESYTGTDFSGDAIEYLGRRLPAESPELAAKVRLLRQPADDFTGIEKRAFDAVVIHSVVQYFPSVEYLLRVIEGAVEALAPGGFLYVGDVQSLPLLEAYHADAQIKAASPELAAEELARRVRQRMALENELDVDPELFRALPAKFPAISRVEIRLRRGRLWNETTRFHYDAILEAGGEPQSAALPGAAVEWKDAALTLEGLRERLEREKPASLVVAGVPNARTLSAVVLARLLHRADRPATAGELAAAAAAGDGADPGVDPEAVWALASAAGYGAEIAPAASADPAAFDVAFSRLDPAAPVRLPSGPPAPLYGIRAWREYTNDPSAAAASQRLAPELRRWLESRLPDYMVPSAFVLMDALPLTPNGKVDRKALPAPDPSALPPAAAQIPPRNAEEKVLAEIVQRILRLTSVGVLDNLFDLGADSLLVFQITTRANQAGLAVTPREVFQHRTIAEIAKLHTLSQDGQHATAAEPRLVAVPRSAYRRPRSAETRAPEDR